MKPLKKLRFAETAITVSDMKRSVKFYESLMRIKVNRKESYKDRWVTVVDDLGLYNPSFDIKHDIERTQIDKKPRHGNNAVIVFHSADIDRDHARAKKIKGARSITKIASINLMAPYRFFHLKDPDGNAIEIGQYL
ncbi:VOC family protein [Patescibacteria group bacterium]